MSPGRYSLVWRELMVEDEQERSKTSDERYSLLLRPVNSAAPIASSSSARSSRPASPNFAPLSSHPSPAASSSSYERIQREQRRNECASTRNRRSGGVEAVDPVRACVRGCLSSCRGERAM